MKTKLLIILILAVVMATSCKKESKAPAVDITTDELSNIAATTPQTFAKLESFMLDALSKAAASGINIDAPPTEKSAKVELSKIMRLKSAKTTPGWTGPDADGWYTMYYESYGLKYTEKIRCKDTTLTYIISQEYSGADGSYSNVTETQYTKYTKNNKVLWKGFTDWKVKTFGDNDISDFEWKFEFNDWNPKTGAGIYDWYWGANSQGGGYEPFQRYLNIIAMEKTADLIHVKVTWYDGAVSQGSFEYDTNWEPIEMPTTPCQ